MIPAFARRAMKLQGDRSGRERHDHHARVRGDERVGVLLQHRADEFGRMHALAPRDR